MDALRIFRRQTTTEDDTDDLYDGYWWYSPTAYAIKWAVIAAILLAALLYFVGGYVHAKRRMQKGLPPLAYHRWLIPRRQRMAFTQQYPQYANQFSFYRHAQTPYGHGQAYPMGSYGPPPPAYGEPDYVPAYTSQGPNKVDPDQNYAPPSGPPPSNTAGLAAPPPAATGGPSYGR
ncbi:uncharacterized protein Z518_09276 [Rhinocladiella mackenziei CBS 650.93]|uniref:Ubiquitin-protein ligase sel1 n=1 Tax=Rhinocladiella mackenziei CBS 650.93 TaxID=1442369 RepID=A0A0D2IYB3_9EURO|nr:uncharacterized protein Z518_09276 [Rhinocladiella mackenziei CBS 650.93]KIX01550.1 hypothetical protein Z518_09276 [Rhinocladiella mackenziei CBS 650.93]